MKKYTDKLYTGMRIIYDGHVIEWCNRKGKIVERFKPGKYVIGKLTDKYAWLKCDRKNATTEYRFNRSEIEENIYCLEFADITTTIGFINMRFFRHDWIVNDKELINKAKQYNKNLV